MSRHPAGARWALALTLVLALVAGAIVAPAEPAAAATNWVDSWASGPATWELTWSDEFTGAAGTLPQADKWRYYEGGVGNNELQRYVKPSDPGDAARQHAALDGNGRLVITARRNTDPNLRCPNSESPTMCAATSARLTTRDTFSQQGGRFEARVKVPAGRGLWPAFWAKGVGTNVNEMDVMEQIGNRGNEAARAYSALHGTGGYSSLGMYTLPSGTFADDFHIFAAEWYPDHISFSIDGVIYHTQYRAAVEQSGQAWPLVEDFYLILNLAVGGDWPGPPDASTPFPSQMLVDYVRVYEAIAPRVDAVGAIPHQSGACMDVRAAQTADGTAVQQYACNGTGAQTWTVATDGTVRALGKCLTAAGTANGSTAELRSCTGGNAAQQWRIEGANQGGGIRVPQLFNPGSGRCLQTATSGAQLEIRDCAATLAQGWNVPSGPTGQWRLADGTGAVAHDASRNRNDAACASGTTWQNDASRGAVAVFSGTGAGCSTQRGPVVDTTRSFTVTAWAKLTAAGASSQTVVAQDGTNASGFYLQYNPAFGSWAFNRMSGDVLNPTGNTATWSPTPPTSDWTHLAGVYDATTRTLTLYVDGVRVGTPTQVATPWSATGPLTIGRARWNGIPASRFTGRISDVRAWPRALSATEVAAIRLP